MGRRKVSMGLIPNRRVRVGTFGKRKEGMKKKAEELSVLCGVDVALVVAAGDGDAAAGAAPDVWESKEGVLARYRALGADARARHTHRAYLEAELGKGEAKLARVRQGGPDGLARWDRALDGVATAEDARSLLDAIDAAMRATEERRRKLGMPDDDGGEDGGGAGVVLEGVAPLNFATGAGAAVGDDYLLQAPTGGGDNNGGQAMWGGGNGFQFQQGAAANAQQAGYGFHQQCMNTGCGGGAGMDGYHHLQMAPGMYGNTDTYQQHSYGFQYFGGGAPSGYQQQQQPNLSMMWGADDEQCRAMVPLEYPSADAGLNYSDTTAAHGAGRSFAMGGDGNFVHSPPALSLAMGTGGGGNFISAPPAAPSSYAMGASSGDNFTNATLAQPLAMSYGGDMTIAGRYAEQWQPQRGGGEQRPSVEHLHYLGDLEDTQLNLWGN
ncbi:unnamed protein product [Urochloa decumbens]|uniref:MADS-box domain-containing protein n=1 Tax=Urochloa decumbens TaxID=240449 RepID=A0ABC8ZQ06_9POAL